MSRAIRESVPLILEGVHCHPDLLHRLPEDTDAIMVHVTLAVMKAKELKSRLRGRGVDVPQRRANRYLNKFNAIWVLQNFLLSEAERCDTQIIPNDDLEAAVYQITGTVSSELSKHFNSSPAEVFTVDVDEYVKKIKDGSRRDLVPHFISTNTDVSSE